MKQLPLRCSCEVGETLRITSSRIERFLHRGQWDMYQANFMCASANTTWIVTTDQFNIGRACLTTATTNKALPMERALLWCWKKVFCSPTKKDVKSTSRPIMKHWNRCNPWQTLLEGYRIGRYVRQSSNFDVDYHPGIKKQAGEALEQVRTTEDDKMIIEDKIPVLCTTLSSFQRRGD